MISETFGSCTFDETESDVSQQIAERATELDTLLRARLKACREASIALTDVEAAVMWANRAICRHGVTDADND